MRVIRLAALALLLLPVRGLAQEVADPPLVLLKNVPFQITVTGGPEASSWYEVRTATGTLLDAGVVEAFASATTSRLTVSSGDELPLTVLIGDTTVEVDPVLTSGWFSIMPPVLAIVLALVFREVITALFAGVWLGALAVAGFNPLAGTARLIDTFVVPTIANVDHASIMVFSLLLGGMVGIIARNGGTLGIVEAVAPLASTPRRGKIATWGAGMAIFFDDYANTLIVGNTMRPITDRLKISREKLAYIVDSTAAPVAALVPISTWVGYEISLISDGLAIAAEQTPAGADVLLAVSPFTMFLQTIPYLFYPLLALAFVLMTSVSDRDFGPMAEAERRAGSGKGLFRAGAVLAADTSGKDMQAKEGVANHWWNAGVPVIAVVVVVMLGLYTSGRAEVGADASLMDIFGAADPFVTLLWGSLAGVLVAIGLSVGQRLLTVVECMDALVGGMRSMMIAMIILVFAWSLGDVTNAIGTSSFLALLLSDRVAIQLIPGIVFVTSAAMAFATGTSWGTMAIMLPVVIPLTVALGGPDVLPGGPAAGILLGGIASVLAGSIFGDHCSPISDTTVLSSTASACDHMDHVRTQLPYALLVAVIATVGSMAAGYGLSPWIVLLGGLGILALTLRTIGTRVDVDGP